MNRLQVAVVAATLAPLAVVTEPGTDDRPWTTVTLGGGGAQYAAVTRGCEGQVLQVDEKTLTEYGAEVRHEFGGAPVLGLRASVQDVSHSAPSVGHAVTVNPNGALEWGGFGIGLGYVHSPELRSDGASTTDLDVLPVSGHVRIGSRRGIHTRISVLENPLPFTTGPFEWTLGSDGRHGRSIGLQAGVSGGGPFDKIGFLTRIEIPIGERFGLTLGGRIGSSEGVTEVGVAGMIRIRLPHEGAASDSA